MNDNMMQNYTNKISPFDRKAIKLFTELGMQKNIAKTLLYISKNGGCKSVEIEQETNQRQPEVCAATNELLKKGWITKRDFKKKRKGRPVQIYKLAYSINEIIAQIEIEKIQEFEKIKKEFSYLKNLVGK